ncbi:MAG: alanine racemase [Mycobacteriales bacterium]
MTAAARAEARVDLDAITANVAVLVERAGAAQVMAVVKADGYGHGLLPSARASLAGGAGWLGVAFLEEALALRAAGVSAPVLCWLAVPGEDLAAAVAADVDLSASATWTIDELAAAGRLAGRPARVHLKVDTGLSRAGATTADWPDLCAVAAKAQAEGVVSVVGVWSHFAYADSPAASTTTRQLAVFGEAVEVAGAAGLQPQLRHLANSAATLTRPDARFDLVRPGLAVYGLSPVPEVADAASLGLTPAMSLRARVALAKQVPAGVGVSYGHRYHPSTDSRLALVPLGYADGVPRAATNLAEVLLAGRRRQISGTVCMDQFVVDVGDDPVQAGDEVVLFGSGADGEPTAQEWADRLGTISYEIVTRVGVRVPRTYTGALAAAVSR